VEVADHLKVISDTFVVNVNGNVTFKFPDGCPDEMIFYSGESGKEYRFGQRSLYSATDGTTFESKIIVNTTVNSFDAAVAKDYSLMAIAGLGKASVDEFDKASKTELIKLRASSTVATSLAENFVFNTASTPMNLTAGELNFALVAKSADATKNFLSVPIAGVVVTNSEIRNYGFSKNGITVANLKTLSYPLITNAFGSAAWAQHAPAKTTAPGTSLEVDNASGYSWNLGEIGLSYAPAVTGGAIKKNQDSVALAINYPVSVVAPLDASKIVSAATAPSESWLISRRVNPTTVIADAGIVIKKVDQSSMKFYQHIYKERGVYKASIVGLNMGTNGSTKVVREFVILVKSSTDNL
ncbi:MAG: DUF5017 domain-containing protein, partial [Paludibacter sp.]